MLFLQLAFLLLLIVICSQKSSCQEQTDDIQFDIPDIVVQYPYPAKTVTLEAFRVRNRTRTEIPKWVSVGYPTIVNNSDGRLFHFTTEYVSVYIRTLDQLQQEAMVKQAKLQYPNENVIQGSVIPLPLAQFACSVNIHVNGSSYQFRGTVYDLRTNPSLLRFPLHRGSQKRAVFESRILLKDDPLYLECELAATGKQEKINSLKITVAQMQEINLADKLLGPSSEKYVVRQQLKKAAQEIQSHLDIEENYEIEDEAFGEDFVQKIVDGSLSHFSPVPIDQALSQLSKYGVSFDRRDLSPTEIKRELSNVLKVSSFEGKERIIVSDSDSERRDANWDASTTGFKGGFKALWGLIDTSVDMDFAMRKSDDWSKNTSSINDQLHELNQHSGSEVKWEREGMRVIPKSLNVATVTRTALNKQMAFTRIKRRLSTAKFHRMYEVGTHNSLFPQDEQRRQFIAAIKDPLQQLNESIRSVIKVSAQEVKSSLKKDIDDGKELTKQEIDNATSVTCVTKTTADTILRSGGRLSLYIKQQFLSISTYRINCPVDYFDITETKKNVTRTNSNFQLLTAWSYCCKHDHSDCALKRITNEMVDYIAAQDLQLKTEKFALKRLDCGDDSWYVNNVIWQDWMLAIVNGQKIWVLDAQYRCCKRGK